MTTSHSLVCGINCVQLLLLHPFNSLFEEQLG